MAKTSTPRKPKPIVTSKCPKNELKSSSATPTSETNKARNLLITDATTPFTFSFLGRYNIRTSLTVHQTPDEETWPGGALWDLGILLAQVLVAAVSSDGNASTTITVVTPAGKPKSTTRAIQLPSRLFQALQINQFALADVSTILELGCGVGLTSLVAASALRAKLTVLTDLTAVIERVTHPNVVQNSSSNKSGFRTVAGLGKVVAVPLCWGCSEDEQAVRKLLQSSDSGPKTRRRQKSEEQLSRSGFPDLILIGDVAYQQKPGAPSHFDALLSTLLQFTDSQTLVVFGTRIRMAGSVDLLNLFLQHFEEQITPPLSAEEVDPDLAGVKHNMSLHFLKRKKVAGGTAETS
jgi:predicted nicotinamide N-methyase